MKMQEKWRKERNKLQVKKAVGRMEHQAKKKHNKKSGITKFQTTDKKIERLTQKEKYETKELKRIQQGKKRRN